MHEQFTEFAVRVTLPGYSPRIIPCATFERDAIRAYDHATELHGEEAVEILRRTVHRTEWVAGKLPPAPPDPDGGLCDPTLVPARPVQTAGSIDTWQETSNVHGPVPAAAPPPLG